jgi:FkbM family methyltransferase
VPLLPPAPKTFLWALPKGGCVRLLYREEVGLLTLLTGDFEAREREAMSTCAKEGTVAIDVGAHVGVMSIVLAYCVGPGGKVVAFEPHPGNLARLQENLELNQLANIQVFPVALNSVDGETDLHLSSDPAYHSIVTVDRPRTARTSIRISSLRLDTVWRKLGWPTVSFVKIDVEGAELRVLEGARETLRKCLPTLLIEARDVEHYRELLSWLATYGYSEVEVEGFRPWNHLFVPGVTRALSRTLASHEHGVCLEDSPVDSVVKA